MSEPELLSVEPVPRRARPLVAWAVILALVAVTVTLQTVRARATDRTGESRAGRLMDELQGRYFVGAADVQHSGESFLPQVRTMTTGPVNRRLRFIVLAGELGGPTHAEQGLADLRGALAEKDLRPPPEDRQLLSDLTRLYADYSAGRWAAPSLGPRERANLARQLGWFGGLALYPARGPDSGARELVLSQARRTFWTIAAAFSFGILAALAGLFGLFLVVAFLMAGSLRPSIGGPLPYAGLYAETFAWWMGLYLGLSLGARWVPAGPYHGLVTVAISLLSLLALGWPVVRGIPWPQVRRDLGLTAGRGVAAEALTGVGCYAAALPLLAVGVVLALLLMKASSAVSGGPSLDPFAPPDQPSHPIIDELPHASGWEFVQMFILAAVMAPLVEETLFRGALFRQLRSATARLGRVLSFLASALVVSFIFAVIHPQGWVAIPLLMALAFTFCLAREWRGSLIPSMIAHGINNGLLLLFFVLALG